MAKGDLGKTVFGDLRVEPVEIYRVETESSVYFVSVHEERGRKYVLVRGQAGSDRENVVVRDSDPRIGERPLFEVPASAWVGQQLDVATMRTSTIVKATRLGKGVAEFPEPVGVGLAPPPGMSERPRIMPVPGRGTNIAVAASSHEVARSVVVPPQQSDAIPYPLRHVMYAENIVALLRSIHRRDGLFRDLGSEGALRERLARALADAEGLIAEIRKRDR
jgi:hypothetical protein